MFVYTFYLLSKPQPYLFLRISVIPQKGTTLNQNERANKYTMPQRLQIYPSNFKIPSQH